jgi:hypothetical protein
MAKKKKSRSKTPSRTNRRLRSSKPIRPSVPARPISRKKVWRVSQPTVRRTDAKALTVASSQSTTKQVRKKPAKKTLTQTNKYNRIVCRKRQERKEVMFAIKSAGKSGQKKQQINPERYIKC